MHIGLRVLYSPGWLGGVNYVLNIARMLHSLPAAERPRVTFLTTAPESETIAADHADLADAIAPLSAAASLDLDFVYPATQLPEAAYGVCWGGWIPDWQCRHRPDMFDDAERQRRFLQYRSLALGPAACVFSSQQALSDTVSLFGEPEDGRYSVFHFPAVFGPETWERSEAGAAATRARLGLPDRYLVVCNQFWKHKNHLAIFKALAARPDLDLNVVMTGALEDTRWPDYTKEIRALLDDPAVADRVLVTGAVERRDQIDILLGARGFIQPSRFEGWSTFVEEARALGLSGVLSDIPVHREQSPPGAQFFDPDDPGALAEALDRFLAEPPPAPSRGEARAASNALIADRARTFLDIAAGAAKRYEPQHHGAVSVAVREIERTWTQTLAGDLDRADFDRFLANLRLSLRDHPEDLAKIAGRIIAEDGAFAAEAQNLLVLATLVKAPGPMRERFLAYDPATDQDADALIAAVRDTQRRTGATAAQAAVEFNAVLFRIRDYVRRKLAPKAEA
ncbi:glycosyltransferase [Maricaulaceae bacterium MS644]